MHGSLLGSQDSARPPVTGVLRVRPHSTQQDADLHPGRGLDPGPVLPAGRPNSAQVEEELGWGSHPAQSGPSAPHPAQLLAFSALCTVDFFPATQAVITKLSI